MKNVLGLISLLIFSNIAFAGSTISYHQSPTNTPGVVTSTTAPVNLYVSTTGNDNNDCVSSGTACLTIQGAVNKIPKNVRDPVIVNTATGSYPDGAFVDGFSFSNRTTPTSTQGPYISIRGAMIAASITGLVTGTVTSTTQGGFGVSYGGTDASVWGTITVTGAGWTVNALSGLLLQITGGTGVGQAMIIDSNTATTITVCGFWPILLDNTSTFQISDWGTTITGGHSIPPGVTGFGFSSTHPVAFSITNNTGGTYKSGSRFAHSIMGLGNLGIDNSGFPDPQIEVRGFKFNGTGFAGIASGGPYGEYIAVRQNRFIHNVFGVRSLTSIWMDANFFDANNTDESSLLEVSAPDLEAGGTGAYFNVFGNYVTTTAGQFNTNAMFEGGGVGLIRQNHVDTVYRGIFTGAQSNVISLGNHMTGVYLALSASLGVGTTPNTSITSDADVCNNAGYSCAHITNYGAQISFQGTALSGSGNARIVDLTDGARVEFATAATATSTTTDILIDNGKPSQATLSLAQLRMAKPKLYESSILTLIFED